MMDNRKSSNNTQRKTTFIKVICTVLQNLMEIKQMLQVRLWYETRRPDITFTFQHILKLDARLVR